MTELSLEEQFINHLTHRTYSSNVAWPSLIGDCRRKLAYMHHQFPALPIDLESAKAFLEGTGIHLALEQELVRANIKIKQVPKFYWKLGNYELAIKVDGVIEYLGKEMVYEAKSCSGSSFSSMMISGEIPHRYYLQLQCYLAALNLELGLLFLWNKGYKEGASGYNGQLIGKIVVPRNPDAIEEVKERLDTVYNSTPDNLPPQDFKPGPDGKLPYECRKCPFVNLCYPDSYKGAIK